MRNPITSALIVVFTTAVLSSCASMSYTEFTGPPPERIVEVDADASAIYEGARQWIAENFKSANDVIQYADADTYTVIGRGRSTEICIKPNGESVSLSTISSAQCVVVRDVSFTFKVEAKDGRMRITIPSLNLVVPPSQYSAGREVAASEEILSASAPHLLQSADSIKAYIESGAKNSSW